jgi:hypothetical protein
MYYILLINKELVAKTNDFMGRPKLKQLKYFSVKIRVTKKLFLNVVHS